MKIYERFIDGSNLRIFNISFTHTARAYTSINYSIYIYIHIFHENFKKKSRTIYYKEISITQLHCRLGDIESTCLLLYSPLFSFSNFETFLSPHFKLWPLSFWLILRMHVLIATLRFYDWQMEKSFIFMEIRKCFTIS